MWVCFGDLAQDDQNLNADNADSDDDVGDADDVNDNNDDDGHYNDFDERQIGHFDTCLFKNQDCYIYISSTPYTN